MAFKRLIAGLWMLALIASLYTVTTTTRGLSERDSHWLAPPPLSELDTPFLNILSLGHRGLFDDFADIWLLQMLVDQRLKSYDPAAINHVLLTVTRHRPRLESLYMISCFELGLDMKHPEYCEHLTLDGLQAFPDSWRIPLTQGFMYAFKMHDPDHAALYYGLAASRPGAPEYLKGLTTKLIERNQLSVQELQSTMENLLQTPGGTKFGSFLKDQQSTSSPSDASQNVAPPQAEPQNISAPIEGAPSATSPNEEPSKASSTGEEPQDLSAPKAPTVEEKP